MCGAVTHSAVLPVVSCRLDPASSAYDPRWRLVVTSCDEHPIMVTVDVSGRDEHGYTQPALRRVS